MRIPLPRRSAGNDGYYGGVGFRPRGEHWVPPIHAGGEGGEAVPAKYRRLRLRRRPSRLERMPTPMAATLVIVVLGFAFLVVYAILRDAGLRGP